MLFTFDTHKKSVCNDCFVPPLVPSCFNNFFNILWFCLYFFHALLLVCLRMCFSIVFFFISFSFTFANSQTTPTGERFAAFVLLWIQFFAVLPVAVFVGWLFCCVFSFLVTSEILNRESEYMLCITYKQAGTINLFSRIF